ncbi:hypothetical protein HMPREF9318_01404 [Streptococcus urinalis FB127-CNA-2]|uniref:Cell division protein SepF n=1 Tax=Streptococcus urinalis 2285-97 TaxID=764291 RepID=G5KD64_9STRE|nr:cell division protein SepF [Streptococcus urinalis]EHJ56325.1 hypothetical protein STRUR_0583 [Streptococcus urinalis 2285-97]EKS19328.1 hypothetical protein HMPREF9318_01404 [Streptococcus urinalis FB127-CNA-2]VEF31459.1 FIG001960: FtsZ-interacting protein related to cell division [Streptococcus urinalis]
MGIRDSFDKIISYFDTEDISDVEETKESTESAQDAYQRRTQQTGQESKRQEPRQQQSVRQSQERPNQQTTPQKPVQQQQRTQRSESYSSAQVSQVNTPSSRYQQQTKREQVQSVNHEKTTIAIKYPRKYEDAQEIVDLLIENECVLIDFQYMLDAQARRCLDFIDGASKVLYGKLQKVGTSMFLLTPSNVYVDIEDMNIPHNGQEVSFDFDMKRR